MKVNVIKNRHVMKDSEVYVCDEHMLYEQPHRPKEQLEMFNYWSEKKRSNVSDNAVDNRLILDYDDCIPRKDVEQQFEDYEYIIYNSANNDTKNGVEKFRVILTLTEPILAKDMAYWRKDKDNRPKLLKFFKGVDISSFDVGRFFYRPSRCDKGGEAVIIKKHEGIPFDFYKHFPAPFEQFEKLKKQMKASRSAPREYEDIDPEEQLEKYKTWFENEYPNGVHRCDVPRCKAKAKGLKVAFEAAEEVFAENYAGHSDWRKWWISITY